METLEAETEIWKIIREIFQNTNREPSAVRVTYFNGGTKLIYDGVKNPWKH